MDSSVVLIIVIGVVLGLPTSIRVVRIVRSPTNLTKSKLRGSLRFRFEGGFEIEGGRGVAELPPVGSGNGPEGLVRPGVDGLVDRDERAGTGKETELRAGGVEHGGVGESVRGEDGEAVEAGGP